MSLAPAAAAEAELPAAAAELPTLPTTDAKAAIPADVAENVAIPAEKAATDVATPSDVVVKEEEGAKGAPKIAHSISRDVSDLSTPGRVRSASVTTRLIGNLQKQDKGSWVTALLYFDKDPGFDTLRQTLSDRLLLMPRFRGRMTSGKSMPHRVQFEETDLADFDPDYHFRVVLGGAGPVTNAAALEHMGSMYDVWQPDMNRPLWQFDYIPQLEDGRALLISKISHVIADGVSQVEILLRMLDPVEDEAEKAAREESRPPAKRDERKSGAFGPLNKARIFASGAFWGIFQDLVRPDKHNSLRTKKSGDVSGKRRFAFTDDISLDRIKEVKSKLEGATVNDVLMLLLTLVMKAYFEEAQDPAVMVKKRTVKVQYPISVRGRNAHAFRDNGTDPRNLFAYGATTLRLRDKGSLLDLFWKIKRDMDAVKLSPAPFATQRFAKVMMPILPLKALNDATLRIARKCTSQISNVAAPSRPVTIAGASVTKLSFIVWAPLAVYIGLCTFNGVATASVCLEDKLDVDPNLIAKHWAPQFEKLYADIMSHEGVIPRPRNRLDKL